MSLLANIRSAADVVRTLSNWPEYYAAAYGFTRPETYDFILRNGVRFRARPNTLDKAILKEVWIRNVYTPAGFEIDSRTAASRFGSAKVSTARPEPTVITTSSGPLATSPSLTTNAKP